MVASTARERVGSILSSCLEYVPATGVPATTWAADYRQVTREMWDNKWLGLEMTDLSVRCSEARCEEEWQLGGSR